MGMIKISAYNRNKKGESQLVVKERKNKRMKQSIKQKNKKKLIKKKQTNIENKQTNKHKVSIFICAIVADY